METIFKFVKGYENLYLISNRGDLISYPSFDANGIFRASRKACKVPDKSTGYVKVRLADINGDCKGAHIHRLVADAFIPNPNNYGYIDHINGIRDDNRVENLRWCTNIQNCNFDLAIENREKTKDRSMLKGKNNYNSQPIDQFDLDGNYIKSFDCMTDAVIELGIKGSGKISAVCRGIRNSAYGFRWAYNGEVKNLWKRESTNQKKKVIKYNLEYEYITEYESISDAARDNDLSMSVLRYALKSKKETCGGFRWRYKK